MIIAVLLASVLMTGLALHFRQPYLWFMVGALWILSGVYALTLSAAAWDVNYFLFWICLAFGIVSILMVLQTRRMQSEEEEKEEEPWGKSDEADAYMTEAGGYADKQQRVSDATGGRRSKKRKRSLF